MKTLGSGVQVCHVYDAAGRDVSLWNVSAMGVSLAIYTALHGKAENRTYGLEMARGSPLAASRRANSSPISALAAG